MPKQLVDIEVNVWHETAKAYLVSLDSSRSFAVWVPKSSCEVEFHPKSRVTLGLGIATLTIPEWLAIEKELV